MERQTINRFQANGQQTPVSSIPGMKVAYGAAAGYRFDMLPPEASEKKGLFGRLKEAIINLVTEEAETDRPIGISQLSRHTFTASGDVSGRSIVRSDRALQDYRFNQLVEPRR